MSWTLEHLTWDLVWWGAYVVVASVGALQQWYQSQPNLPRLIHIADHISKLVSRHNVGWCIFSIAQLSRLARYSPQEIVCVFIVTLFVICKAIDGGEHAFARFVQIVQCAIAVVRQKVVFIKYGQRYWHRKTILRRNIAINVAKRVALWMPFGLLETEFDQQFEEIICSKRSRNVRCMLPTDEMKH